jgi:hypothetical protein
MEELGSVKEVSLEVGVLRIAVEEEELVVLAEVKKCL